MAPDIFYPEDVSHLLHRKVVIFLGDSNVRAVYKDFVTLTQKRSLITKHDLKAKMEKSYFGDRLEYHGQLCNGRDYKEEREFDTPMRGSYCFYFLTRIYNKYTEGVFKMIEKKKPQVVIMNSCLWDVTRWGPTGVEEYKKNLRTAMKRLRKMVPSDCLIIWLTCAPITQDLNGGFLVKQLEFLKYSLRFHVMEANYYAHKVAVETGVDVLDVHHGLRMHVHLRAEDGIHWQPPAVRHVTNLILTHISLAFQVPLPHRFPPQDMPAVEVPILKPSTSSQRGKRQRNKNCHYRYNRPYYNRRRGQKQVANHPQAFQNVQPFPFGQHNIAQPTRPFSENQESTGNEELYGNIDFTVDYFD